MVFLEISVKGHYDTWNDRVVGIGILCFCSLYEKEIVQGFTGRNVMVRVLDLFDILYIFNLLDKMSF